MEFGCQPDVLSVLNFVKHQKDDESEFDREWNRSVSVEEFRTQCKNRLKKIYAEVEIRILPEADDFIDFIANLASVSHYNENGQYLYKTDCNYALANPCLKRNGPFH